MGYGNWIFYWKIVTDALDRTDFMDIRSFEVVFLLILIYNERNQK